VSQQTLRNWVKQAQLDDGRHDDGLTTQERKELRRLRREVRDLQKSARSSARPRCIQPVSATPSWWELGVARLGRPGLSDVQKRQLWDRGKAWESISQIARRWTSRRDRCSQS
jgi:hypothetical protein